MTGLFMLLFACGGEPDDTAPFEQVTTETETDTATDTGTPNVCFDPEFMIMEWSFGWDAAAGMTVPVERDGQAVRSSLSIHIWEEASPPFFDVAVGDWDLSTHCTVVYYLDNLPASSTWAVDQGMWLGLDGVDAYDAWTDCDEWACSGNFSEIGAVDHFAQWSFELGMGGGIDGYVGSIMPDAFDPPENYWGGYIGGTIFAGPPLATVAHGYTMTDGAGTWLVDDAIPLTSEDAAVPTTGFYVVMSPWFWQLL